MEEIEPNDFNIVCYHCGGFLTVSDEFVGMEVQCPACEEEMMCPPALRAAKLENRSEPIPREVADAEKEALAQEDPGLIPYLHDATNKNCWEFGFISHLVQNALGPLEKATGGKPAQPAIFQFGSFTTAKAPDFFVDITKLCNQFFGLLDELYPLVGPDLSDALYCDDIIEMLSYGKRLQKQLATFPDFCSKLYEQTVPPDPPYPRLLAIMQGWPEHCFSMLEDLAGRLREAYETGGKVLPYTEVQASLFPPDLQEFAVLKDKLPQKVVFRGEER